MDEYFIHVTLRLTPISNKDFKCEIIPDKEKVLKKTDYNYRITTSFLFRHRCYDTKIYGEDNNGLSPDIIRSFEMFGLNKNQCENIFNNAFYTDLKDSRNDGVSIEDAIKICKIVKLPFTSVFVLLPKNNNYLEDKEAGSLAYYMDKFILEETEYTFSFDKINIDISDTQASILIDLLTSLRKNKY